MAGITVTYTLGNKTLNAQAASPRHAITVAHAMKKAGSDACIIDDNGKEYRLADYEALHRA
jgi:hypothetical protein